LVELGHKHHLTVIDDIGSGALHDFADYGVRGEPIVGDSLRAGADVVLFSGDKLLGGPQCGIILGGKQHIDRIRKHPLMRALRVDKLTLAALFATLRLHQDRERAEQSVPLLELLSTATANLQNRAERLAPQIAACSAVAAAEPISAITYLGGGSVPMQEIPTWCIAMTPASGNVDSLAKSLRTGIPSVFGRIQKDRLLLDLRTVFARQDLELVEAVRRLGTGQPEAETGEPQADADHSEADNS
jgi:L-seryl-tRNA(Ser) seleniumtransferase